MVFDCHDESACRSIAVTGAGEPHCFRRSVRIRRDHLNVVDRTGDVQASMGVDVVEVAGCSRAPRLVLLRIETEGGPARGSLVWHRDLTTARYLDGSGRRAAIVITLTAVPLAAVIVAPAGGWRAGRSGRRAVIVIALAAIPLAVIIATPAGGRRVC